MARENKRKCLSCADYFTVDARNRGRQKYCPQPQCRRQSKAVSQHRWLNKPENRYHFRDAENAARAREWQRAHPGYWKNTTRYKSRTARALQDSSACNLLSGNENNAINERPLGPNLPNPSALQDALNAPGPLLLGLIATLVDSALQDDLAATSRRLLQLGQDILGGRKSNAHQTSAAP